MENPLLKKVLLGDIETHGSFILSWARADEDLKDSLAAVGQVSPLIVRPDKGKLILVCGLRRLRVMKELGFKSCLAVVLSGDIDRKTACLTAIEDNLGQRGFNDAEKALAVKYLKEFFSDGEIIEQYLRRLNLPPRPEYLQRYLKLADLGPEGLTALARGRLDPETAEALLDLPPATGAAIAKLLDDLAPGLNKRREIMAWLTEIARRENRDITAILGDAEIRSFLDDDHLQRPQKEKKVREWLRRRRYPRLTELEARQSDAMKTLNLPKGMRLQPPPHFEGLDFHINFSFSNKEELAEAVRVLGRLIEDSSLDDLLELG